MTTTSLPPHADRFRAALRRWYRSAGRHDLPWRQTRDPYAVLVSELMLQQTQVARVIPYYERWLARWPDAGSLAAASVADVIRAWGGLGYNRRALALQRTAVVAVERFAGHVPVEVALLEGLPGVGRYTARAVASFAGGVRVPVVETNAGRVLARTLGGAAVATSPAAAWALAEALLPPQGARDHNLALMDLGATVCTARRPSCGTCPAARVCAWNLAGRPGAAVVVSRPAAPFESTARYARGRIVDALRSGGQLSEGELASGLPEKHQGSLGIYLDSLRRDGLVVGVAGGWALPGAV